MQIDLNLAWLFIGLINGALIGSLLLFRSANRVANTVLAWFIFILVGRILVYILGSGGLYDPHSWLYVAPVEVSLAYGPLIYLYLRAITGTGLVRRWWLHLLPAMLQVGYYAVLTLFSETTIVAWILSGHISVIAQLESALVLLSISAYLLYSWRHYRHYQRWLGNHISDKENYRLPWLVDFLAVNTLLVTVWAVFLAVGFWIEFNYQRHFFLFATQSILLFYLALESWRHSSLTLPPMPSRTAIEQLANKPEQAEPGHGQALQQQAHQWLQTIRDRQWWRDPDLTLSRLAGLLGTNTTTLSAVLNQGLKQNFNTVINRIRTQSVCERIDSQTDEGLLTIAFEAGFNSKNSFNRSFKRFTGVTPSQYRRNRSVKS